MARLHHDEFRRIDRRDTVLRWPARDDFVERHGAVREIGSGPIARPVGRPRDTWTRQGEQQRHGPNQPTLPRQGTRYHLAPPVSERPLSPVRPGLRTGYAASSILAVRPEVGHRPVRQVTFPARQPACLPTVQPFSARKRLPASIGDDSSSVAIVSLNRLRKPNSAITATMSTIWVSL